QFKKMRELVPESYRAFLDFDKQAFKDGAIPGKTKELIALGIAQITQCPWCIQAHTKKAATAGGSDAEIAETTLVAMAMGARPARRGATAGWRCSACRSTGAAEPSGGEGPRSLLRGDRGQRRRDLVDE